MLTAWSLCMGAGFNSIVLTLLMVYKLFCGNQRVCSVTCTAEFFTSQVPVGWSNASLYLNFCYWCPLISYGSSLIWSLLISSNFCFHISAVKDPLLAHLTTCTVTQILSLFCLGRWVSMSCVCVFVRLYFVPLFNWIAVCSVRMRWRSLIHACRWQCSFSASPLRFLI